MPEMFGDDAAIGYRPRQGRRDGGIVVGVDPRLRLVATLIFAVTVVTIDSLAVLAAAVGVALLLAIAARLPLVLTCKRLLAIDLFVVATLLMLPFTMPGQPMFAIGGLVASRDGVLAGITIALRANAVVLALLALVGSMDATMLGYALRRLRLPDKLVQVLFFTVRYTEVLADEFARLRLAMRARAFRPRTDLHTWRGLGYLVGMVLVRSFDRSERVLAAMRCRGFDGRLHGFDELIFGRRDLLFGGAFLAVLAALLWMEHAWSNRFFV